MSFQEAFGRVLWNFYGATETGLVSLAGPEDHEQRPGTVGRPLPGNEIRILDDDDRELPRGEIGAIAVRNGMLIRGYDRDEGATAAAFHDGFFAAGDLGRIDEDGYLYLEGRKHDLIISGGVNVYPVEIENYLALHPKVLDVAVIGVPDPEWGERVKAVVVPRPGCTLSADELDHFCRKGLAPQKTPRLFELRDELPRNPTGKVLKRELSA